MRDTAVRAGVNWNRTVLVNLKEHCANVHGGKRAAATAKALRLVWAGVEKALRAEKLEPIVSDVNRSAAVIGGGISGLTVARSLAARDIPVTLIEREAELGGTLRSINRLFPSYCNSAEYVREVAAEASGDPNVEMWTSSRVTGVAGHAGDFRLTVESADSSRELSVGCVVLATGADVLGADVLVPDGLFEYGDNPKVVTQLEFEAMLREGLGTAKRIVMIQCVGSRNEERPYCSRVCCTATVKNTITVLEQVPNAEITVLTRGFAQYVGDLDRARRRRSWRTTRRWSLLVCWGCHPTGTASSPSRTRSSGRGGLRPGACSSSAPLTGPQRSRNVRVRRTARRRGRPSS
jgi:heterodisulfide reductase subunit A